MGNISFVRKKWNIEILAGLYITDRRDCMKSVDNHLAFFRANKVVDDLVFSL